MNSRINMCVTALNELTSEIKEFTLSPVSGGLLPSSTAGGHITVKTPSGAMRRYSLIHPSKSPEHYTIAVKRDANSRGGSASMHEQLKVGQAIDIEPPKNEFALTEAESFLLIAGGIGVTPIYAMAETLTKLGKPFKMIYCTRTREATAFGDNLQALCEDALTLHHDQGDPALVYDFWDHFETPGKSHVYCCGPAALMEEIKAISGHWPEGHVHFEDFSRVDITRPDDRPFKVILQKSGRTITVPADRSILEAIRESGLDSASSCESGTCGTCKCGLISGDVDHRDMVLMEDEKGDHIMICVSRANQGELVLDL